MRGNAARGSHNVTHKYRESESICTYARARANATGFPGSLYRGAAHLLSRQVCAAPCCATTPTTVVPPRSYLCRTSSLSRKRSPRLPVRPAAAPPRSTSIRKRAVVAPIVEISHRTATVHDRLRRYQRAAYHPGNAG